MGTPCAIDLSMKLNQTILKAIAYQLYTGNPWWGLLLTNEYLLPDSPLHATLRALFRKRVPEGSELAEKLLSGARSADLSAEHRSQIGARAPSHTKLSIARPRSLDATPVPRHRRLPPPRARSLFRPHKEATDHRNSRRTGEKPTERVLSAAPALRIV